MSDKLVTILVGGAAGQGLATVGQLLSKSLSRSGYHVSVSQVYMSRIRGGFNTFAIRAGAECTNAPDELADIVIALNQDAVEQCASTLRPGGLLVLGDGLDPQGHRSIRIPLASLAPKPIYYNVAGSAVVGALIGIPQIEIAQLLEESFSRKGEDVVKQNLDVLRDSYAWALGQEMTCRPLPESPEVPWLLMNGNEAIALGALAGGCNFCSFYPMTPGTSIAQTLISKGAELGVVVEQVEDEIAALNMAQGASYAGARSIVPTSGGGFALMTEAMSLAGVAETPVVAAIAQRPGPATGLPTHTEQADLNLALYAGHGEFPRAILTPGTVEECFQAGFQAMNLAEKYQTPVVILTDQYLADNIHTVEAFDLESLPSLHRPAEHSEFPEGAYQRYALTESGISPRLIPGFGPHCVVADSHEHLESGKITEDPVMRNAQNEKRMRKEQGMLAEALSPVCSGDEHPDLLLVGWGSSLGAIKESAELLREQNVRVAVMHFRQVWPLPTGKLLDWASRARATVCIESNITGQFAGLVRKVCGLDFDLRILRYDGLPLTAGYIYRALDTSDLQLEQRG